MPYKFIRQGKKVKIVKKDTGQVVATASSLQNAKGYAYHATQGEKKV